MFELLNSFISGFVDGTAPARIFPYRVKIAIYVFNKVIICEGFIVSAAYYFTINSLWLVGISKINIPRSLCDTAILLS